MREPGHGRWIGLATLLYGVPLLVALFLGAPLAPERREADPEAGRPSARMLVLAAPLAEDEEEEPADDRIPEPPPEDPEPAPTDDPPDPSEPDQAPDDVEPDPNTSVQPEPAEAALPAGGRPALQRVPTGVRRTGATVRPVSSRPRGTVRRTCDQPHPNVRVGADGVIEIDQSLVDRYTADLGSFMELGYSKPYDDGGVEGWYIAGFTCTSPVFKAGFRRGDVLLSVNGRKTRSWMGVYLMYQKLKRDDAFEVSLVRKGQPMTLRFRVVPG